MTPEARGYGANAAPHGILFLPAFGKSFSLADNLPVFYLEIA